MELADRYGFIVSAYGGTALLATHEVQKDIHRQKYGCKESGCYKGDKDAEKVGPPPKQNRFSTRNKIAF